MRKIKIKQKGFPSTHYGYLAPGLEIEVSDGFASFCVERMRAAEYLDDKPKPKPKARTPRKKTTPKKSED